MSKSNFVKYFQKNLREYLESLIVNEWGYEGITVTCEDCDISGKFNGYMDISIRNKNNDTSIVAIEIEHKSDYGQAQRNIEKLKKWSHNSAYRICCLLHIFNEVCNIHPNNIGKLVRYAKDNQYKNHGFYYDFIFYQVLDMRKTSEIAKNLIKSMDFKTRIWMLIEDAKII